MFTTPLRWLELTVDESIRKLFDSLRAPLAFMLTPNSLAVQIGAGLRVGLRAAGGASEHAGRQHDEVEEVAARQRQVFELVLLDQARDASLRRLDQRRRRLHRHLLDAAPTSIVKLMVLVSATWSRMFSWMTVLKPWSVARMV